MQKVSSVLIWAGIVLLVLVWVPLLSIRRFFDRDPTLYKTGYLFRKLGLTITKINPNWTIELENYEHIDHRQPFIMVSNHLSNADIPVISNLPWEMKWIAKKELFDMPVLGWLLKFAGDIAVDRSSTGKRAAIFQRCKYYLDRNVSVIFFPEGTRSRTGKLTKFAVGAFDLAIKENIPILPIVLDGTQKCLPKKSWIYDRDVFVKLKVLDPVPTDQYDKDQSYELMNNVRQMIAEQLSEWRSQPLSEVDSLHS
jgi:1-acyl-sn-glycerol-3-phosphate acyltransferase